MVGIKFDYVYIRLNKNVYFYLYSNVNLNNNFFLVCWYSGGADEEKYVFL